MQVSVCVCVFTGMCPYLTYRKFISGSLCNEFISVLHAAFQPGPPKPLVMLLGEAPLVSGSRASLSGLWQSSGRRVAGSCLPGVPQPHLLWATPTLLRKDT